jgi:hypothetical protein
MKVFSSKLFFKERVVYILSSAAAARAAGAFDKLRHPRWLSLSKPPPVEISPLRGEARKIPLLGKKGCTKCGVVV